MFFVKKRLYDILYQNFRINYRFLYRNINVFIYKKEKVEFFSLSLIAYGYGNFLKQSDTRHHRNNARFISRFYFNKFSIACLGSAPTALLTTFPPFNTTSVGMLITPNCCASSDCSSTFILPTFTLETSRPIWSMTGPTILPKSRAKQGLWNPGLPFYNCFLLSLMPLIDTSFFY